jgi:DNA-binding NarL/FixJ family response regulator
VTADQRNPYELRLRVGVASDAAAVDLLHAHGMTAPLAIPVQLTPREHEVATLLAYGFTNTEIAERLTISIRTAEMHRANALRKLGVDSRAGVVRWALDHDLLR